MLSQFVHIRAFYDLVLHTFLKCNELVISEESLAGIPKCDDTVLMAEYDHIIRELEHAIDFVMFDESFIQQFIAHAIEHIKMVLIIS